MKIMVTGALGHIGSRLIRELPVTFPGADVVMVDNLSTLRYGSLFNLPTAGRYRFVEGDVLKIDLVPLMEGASVVVHLAAITDATSSFDNKNQVEHVNYTASLRVAQACLKTGASMIHLSSASVYGTQKTVVDENCSAEDLKPQSPYAETKLKEERMLKELAASAGLRFVTCRFGTIAGVSPGMRFHTAVNKFCWQAIMGQPLTVWRTALHQKRPYLALSDAMRAFEFIIEKGLFDGSVYNVLTDNLTVHDIIESIRAHVPGVEVTFVDTAIMNQLSYEVSSRRFTEKGFVFRGSVKESIDDTVRLLKAANGRSAAG